MVLQVFDYPLAARRTLLWITPSMAVPLNEVPVVSSTQISWSVCIGEQIRWALPGVTEARHSDGFRSFEALLRTHTSVGWCVGMVLVFQFQEHTNC